MVSSAELLTSLLIAFVIGAVAGIFARMSLVDGDAAIDQKSMLTIVGAGYAGTDFIEGFMKSNMPDPELRNVGRRLRQPDRVQLE